MSYCIDILLLIHSLFSLTNNSPFVTVAKALLSPKKNKPAELITLVKKIIYLV